MNIPSAVAVIFVFGVAPLASPNWLSWLLVMLVGGGLLGWGWGEVWPVRPAESGYAGAAMVFVALCTAAFGAGAAARAGGLALQRRGRRRRDVLWTDALGLSVPAVLLLSLWLG